MGNKNLRRLRCLVTAQTMGNLERLAVMDGCGDVGRMVDKLTREKMLSIRIPAQERRGQKSPPRDGAGGCDAY